MASLTKVTHLFGFTSPRTIEKIIPEIELLTNNFSGSIWTGNTDLQASFFDALFHSEFYEGGSYPSDPAFSARERITRAPKALGFVDLKPTLQLTEAGYKLLTSKRPHETITKQLLKFQLPSPFHTQSKRQEFYVKPYLELLRLISDLGSISKDEIALFFLQLTHLNKYQEILNKILAFRANKASFNGSYKTYVHHVASTEIQQLFEYEISNGKLKTRETTDDSLAYFIQTKRNNMNDYADAFMRYLRGTQLVTVDARTYRMLISTINKKEVEFILNNIPREPVQFPNEQSFKQFLFSEEIELLSDNKALLAEELSQLGVKADEGLGTTDLKNLLDEVKVELYEKKIEETTEHLKTYQEYDDILDIFQQINKKKVPDAPLYLEWNVWRALVMLNHAKRVHGNFVLDLDGMPLNTAPGKKPDIEVDYNNFSMIVEVTTSTGQKQYEMEGEPVARHFGRAKAEIHENMYCIFIAPRISEGTLSHYFTTNQINNKYYGGKTKIIPMTIENFMDFIKIGKEECFSDPEKLEHYLDSMCKLISECNDEEEWLDRIQQNILSWAS